MELQYEVKHLSPWHHEKLQRMNSCISLNIANRNSETDASSNVLFDQNEIRSCRAIDHSSPYTNGPVSATASELSVWSKYYPAHTDLVLYPVSMKAVAANNVGVANAQDLNNAILPANGDQVVSGVNAAGLDG